MSTMPGNHWFERAYAFFSVLGLTRPETHAVLVLAVGALVGATLSTLRPYWNDHDAADPVASVAFRTVSNALLNDTTLTKESRDSLLALIDSDSVTVQRWTRQADSLRRMLVTDASRDSIREMVRRIEDDPVGMIDVNEADAEVLATLPGIGPKLAQRIVEYRIQNGPFRQIDDLKRVKGIGKKMFEKIKPFVDIR